MHAHSAFSSRKISMLILLALMAGLLATLMPVQTPRVSAQTSYLLSLNRPTYASSRDVGNTSDRAVDGDLGTIWSSAWSGQPGGGDPQWIYLDLGGNANITQVKLRWEGAYATSYKIQTSNDEYSWIDRYTTTTGDGGLDDLAISVSGVRYVRMLGTARALPAYGYALYEFEVYGTGGANPAPVTLGTNVALNRPVAASSVEVEEWIPTGSTNANLAVDGNTNTRWGSNRTNSEWLSVDLGSARQIGRIILHWEAAYGRVYDLQVSIDNVNWTTIYRQLNGMGGIENIQVYANARYVRMLGHARGSGFGYSIFELQVYNYVTNDPQPSYSIPALPGVSTTAVGSGSYRTDYTLMQPRYPRGKGSVNTPLPSNKWWTSILVNPQGNGIVPLPWRAKFTRDRGLSLYNPPAPYVTVGGGAIETTADADLNLLANNIVGNNPTTRLGSYSDWAVDVIYSDDSAEKMRVTFVKGSPYVFAQFNSSTTPEIFSPYITRLFDLGNGTVSLPTPNDTRTSDFLGIEVTNNGVVRSYGLHANEGTVFRRVGNKIKISLGYGSTYLSISALPASPNIGTIHNHAYAFVTNTVATGSYDAASANVTTQFNITTSLKRSGYSSDTMMGLFPHQWKNSSAALTSMSYDTIRGVMKLREGNSFSTSQRFYGVTPSFGEPTSSSTYTRAQMQTYINDYKAQILADYWVPDPYWQGKKLHTLSMAILIADQIGDTTSRDQLKNLLRTIMVDWLTYGDTTGANTNDVPYYMYYSPTWGTINGDGGDHGMALNLSDHHFLWAYFTFPAAVLGMYDSTFVTQYGGMIDHLIRDHANPSRTDSLYPYMRNFDPYAGHSWAGGYGDNDSGNNQESASEALFAWSGVYLWGLLTNNASYRDAGIWGFTLEENAVEQYWFNYDQDNWPGTWTHGTIGILYGTSALYGTYFSGAPENIYGIHWLPTAPYITYYGRDVTDAARLYSEMVEDNGNLPEDGWQHIIWPIQALSNSQAVLNKWSAAAIQADGNEEEIFNTYWFIHNVHGMGQRTNDIWATNWTSYSVFKKGTTYTAVAWNPTGSPITVQFRNAAGNTGTLVVPAGKTVSGNPMTSGGDPSNLALNRTVFTSSSVNGNTGDKAVDGNAGTRWESASSDPQWIYVDLGSTQNIGRVKLVWEAAYGKDYTIQTSNDASSWTTIKTVTNENGGTDDHTGLTGSGRYVRINGTARGTGYGYSPWEFEVYAGASGGGGGSCGTTNIAQGDPSSASSGTAASAFDGNATGTRWESTHGVDPQWIQVDLGSSQSICRVELVWETAYATAYTIQTSNDATNWTTIKTVTGGDGGTDDHTGLTGTGRYVRMHGTARATGWGYSLWEMRVYQGSGGGTTNLALNKATTASSAIQAANNATDGNASTRWESTHGVDPQWLQVDLGATQSISRVKLVWEPAYATAYTIQTSNDGTNWTTIKTVTGNTTLTNDHTGLSGSGRYVRIHGTARGTVYGYSLFDFEVY